MYIQTQKEVEMHFFRFIDFLTKLIRYVFMGLSIVGAFLCFALLFGVDTGLPGWSIALMMFARVIPHALAIVFMLLTCICYMIGVECLPEYNGEMSKLHKSFNRAATALFKAKKAQQKEELK